MFGAVLRCSGYVGLKSGEGRTGGDNKSVGVYPSAYRWTFPPSSGKIESHNAFLYRAHAGQMLVRMTRDDSSRVVLAKTPWQLPCKCLCDFCYVFPVH